MMSFKAAQALHMGAQEEAYIVRASQAILQGECNC